MVAKQDKQTTKHDVLDGIVLGFEYNETWNDAKRHVRKRTIRE